VLEVAAVLEVVAAVLEEAAAVEERLSRPRL